MKRCWAHSFILPLMVITVLLGMMTALGSCKKVPKDGNYCAKVTYQKENSKKTGNFTLIVEVKNNQLVDISFPEGYYDISAIKPVDIPADGKFTAVSASGYVYKLQMIGPAEKCQKAVNMVQCKGTTSSGKRCQRYTDNKSGYCWQHKK
ncbi:MAG TPA: hypothetical protein PK047_01720 [Saprospiraceae bacterium]|nr:hypothetical protein [Saprospiraceae bacterium]HRO07554.1 hypothetical protein [Saprospiraceae bacterium]HRP40837.1 hypothetical protein [Saprospiraceae bacterium]